MQCSFCIFDCTVLEFETTWSGTARHTNHIHTQAKMIATKTFFVSVKPVDSKQAWICETLCDFFLRRSIPKTEAEHLIKLPPGRRGHIDWRKDIRNESRKQRLCNMGWGVGGWGDEQFAHFTEGWRILWKRVHQHGSIYYAAETNKHIFLI